MISKARTKFIKSLQLKKYRSSTQNFVVEGTKSVREVLASDFRVTELYATQAFLDENTSLCRNAAACHEADTAEMAAAGSFRTNDGALAVVEMKPNRYWNPGAGYGLVLDGINDPGNLGTIIRIADWFGISGIVASEAVVDLYNPKVIAASKGSFTRVPVYYTSLPEFMSDQNLPFYGADLQGEDVHSFRFENSGWIVLGSEAHGISEEVKKKLSGQVTIRKFGQAESLNAAMAAAIICDNLQRIRNN